MELYLAPFNRQGCPLILPVHQKDKFVIAREVMEVRKKDGVAYHAWVESAQAVAAVFHFHNPSPALRRAVDRR